MFYQAIIGFMALALMLIFVFGWIFLLISGIVKLRRGVKQAGTIMTITGAVWGAMALAFIVFGVYSTIKFTNMQNAETFDAASYKGDKGRIKALFNGESTIEVTKKGKEKPMELVSDNGEFYAPVGEYKIDYYEMRKKDKSGYMWSAYSYIYGSKNLTATVEKDSDAEIDVGQSLTASVSAKKSGEDVITVSLRVNDSKNHYFAIMDKNSKAPGFVAVDKNGKTVMSGDFEYG